MTDFAKPTTVSQADLAFGGAMDKLLPPYASIPAEFKRYDSPWAKWQAEWFYNGLKRRPVAKEGIDLGAALRHLGAIQGSFDPKHEHKSAGVAYLASLWFSSPDGEEIKPREKSAA